VSDWIARVGIDGPAERCRRCGNPRAFTGTDAPPQPEVVQLGLCVHCRAVHLWLEAPGGAGTWLLIPEALVSPDLRQAIAALFALGESITRAGLAVTPAPERP
jgi:hypothetical protein